MAVAKHLSEEAMEKFLRRVDRRTTLSADGFSTGSLMMCPSDFFRMR